MYNVASDRRKPLGEVATSHGRHVAATSDMWRPRRQGQRSGSRSTCRSTLRREPDDDCCTSTGVARLPGPSTRCLHSFHHSSSPRRRRARPPGSLSRHPAPNLAGEPPRHRPMQYPHRVGSQREDELGRTATVPVGAAPEGAAPARRVRRRDPASTVHPPLSRGLRRQAAGRRAGRAAVVAHRHHGVLQPRADRVRRRTAGDRTRRREGLRDLCTARRRALA